ncbi:MAG: hypothetical protein KAS32_17845 [Candidatus Peribacteraceae bacterium]|nr:hypothetical protein [Candidatus Peribacteraceae bacterium]
MECKTAEDVCNLLLFDGFKEYEGDTARFFVGPIIGETECEVNGRPPKIKCVVHTKVDYVQFGATGFRSDMFIDFKSYQFLYKDITKEKIEQVTRIMAALWETYCRETKGE